MTFMICEFKCRRCGEVFDGPIGNKDIVFMALIEATIGLDNACARFGVPVSKHSIHTCCKDQGYGIGDLIGARPEK